MLKIQTNEQELWDDVEQRFIVIPSSVYTLEHSLQSISKWEQEFKIPFLTSDEKTPEQLLRYFELMDLTEELDKMELDNELVEQITTYMADEATATTFNSPVGSSNTHSVVTSEVIYAQMAMAQIPFTADTWNINRLTTLLRVYNNFNSTKRKKSKSEILAENRRLNDERRRQFNSKG